LKSIKFTSLRWKLAGALVLVVLVSVGVMAVLTNRNTSTQFQQYQQFENEAYSWQIVETLQEYYDRNSNWDGVHDVLHALLRMNIERLILTDSSGTIISDTQDSSTGQSVDLSSLTGTDIEVDGDAVGTVYIYEHTMIGGMGRGPMSGRMQQPVSTPTPVTTAVVTPQDSFINRVNNYLWIAALIASAVALVVGIFITRQITRPLKELSFGAKQISVGNLRYRVKSKSKDELGELSEAFNEMAVKLESSEQARKRLISDVSHELKTPLTIIEGTVRGIEDGVFHADEEHLGVIKEQTSMLTSLIGELRVLSMAEAGVLKLELQPVNMVDLILSKISQFETQAKEKSIRMKLNSIGQIPDVMVDRRQIDQVITNLLSNALRHTPEGGLIVIGTKYKPVEEKTEKAWLVISVTDNGEGITEEHLPHIFDRFYRIEGSRARSEGGTGLGLAIVKQLVQAHGGQVWVHSEVGKGTSFYFSLAVKEAPAEDAKSKKTTKTSKI